ncbi:hypothetical protein ABZ070_24715 [Streptomyces sp. NPDC006283]|uniref:hypothetical protein n=1 Tax=Streptomyces sp. NPDC006283 TaxID=3156741 RepID=UPI0033ACAF0D
MNKIKSWKEPTPRGLVLAILGIVTLGVAVLSMAVSYQILEPKFGAWAVPTVGALDALWVVFQATEILAGNNNRRARRVQVAGLALTAVNAGIPTWDLILHNGTGTFDLAVVLTPIAIVATKTAWWIALPSLGRPVSRATRRILADKRQTVADKLETMEAEASHRIEVLRLATDLEKQVADAETAYRLSTLKIQQTMTEDLHKQAEATAKTVTEKALPAAVAAIRLPELETWTPGALALPGPASRDGSGTASGTDAEGRHTTGTQASAGEQDEASRQAAQTVTLQEVAAVTGVPVPVPGEQLSSAQLGVVLRHLRYSKEPPMSYRQAVKSFREAGFVGSEERVRHEWGALMSNEDKTEASEGSEDDTEEEAAGA